MSRLDGYASLADVEAALVQCRACPRLVAWREQVGREKRAAFRDQEYWARPVPGFGDPAASLVLVGLAPAAHGANRTGRMFSGDRSGAWLFRALHRAGLANQPSSSGPGDGLRLTGAWITAPVRCAPPQNRPTAAERDRCATWLDAELAHLPNLRVYVALGAFGHRAILDHLDRQGASLPRPRPRFGHGSEAVIPDGRHVVASYHPSQQNTFTGRLSEPMLDNVIARAVELAAAAAR